MHPERFQPGVLIGTRYYTPDDKPFEIATADTAARLVKEGVIEVVVHMAETRKAVAVGATDSR